MPRRSSDRGPRPEDTSLGDEAPGPGREARRPPRHALASELRPQSLFAALGLALVLALAPSMHETSGHTETSEVDAEIGTLAGPRRVHGSSPTTTSRWPTWTAARVGSTQRAETCPCGPGGATLYAASLLEPRQEQPAGAEPSVRV